MRASRLRARCPAARIVATALSLSLVAAASWADEDSSSLLSMSLEELMELDVTSVSRKDQPIAESAAAIYVITSEDLRRSGVTSVPEALRMVPGMQVSRINSNLWAISARGFTERFANKTLVLRDGRTLYTPLFGGVYWNVQDVMLEDVDRIEVIRGPGGTLWGANAVNGVINIVTKSAEETKGLLATASHGNEQSLVALRWGGSIGDRGAYRVFGRAFDHGSQANDDGSDASDEWEGASAGVRFDWTSARGDAFTVQGEVFDDESVVRQKEPIETAPFEIRFDDPIDTEVANVLARWTRPDTLRGELSVQAFVDRTRRQSFQIGEERWTYDFELQHRFRFGHRHELVWGLGARVVTDETTPGRLTELHPRDRTDELYSGFVQDEISFRDDRVKLTLGTKIEDNDYTGDELQPNARLWWEIGRSGSAWAAVSRAIRSTARVYSDVRQTIKILPDPTMPGVIDVLEFRGHPNLDAEELIAYELGARGCAAPSFCVDVALFRNEYEEMAGAETLEPTFDASAMPPRVVIPLQIANTLEYEATGGEIVLNWAPREWIRTQLWYAYLDFEKTTPSPVDDLLPGQESLEAEHRAHARVQIDVSNDVSLDVFAYYVDELRFEPAPVDAYTRIDVRVAYRPTPTLELELGARNLTDDQHLEFTGDRYAIPTRIERAVYGALTWRF